jgi:hypothetical protein
MKLPVYRALDVDLDQASSQMIWPDWELINTAAQPRSAAIGSGLRQAKGVIEFAISDQSATNSRTICAWLSAFTAARSRHLSRYRH